MKSSRQTEKEMITGRGEGGRKVEKRIDKNANLDLFSGFLVFITENKVKRNFSSSKKSS